MHSKKLAVLAVLKKSLSSSGPYLKILVVLRKFCWFQLWITHCVSQRNLLFAHKSRRPH